MNSPLRRLLCLSWCAAILWPTAASAEQTSPSTASLTPAAVADFEWFGTLGFPDVRGCPAGRVSTGETIAYNGHPPENQYVTAFLLHQGDGGRFTVLTPDLFTRDFTATAPGTPEPQRVGFEKKSLADSADAYLKELAGLSTDADGLMSRDFRNRLAERAQVFVWAWACWRNGLDDRAARLYTYAAALPKYFHGQITEPANFHFMLEQDFSYSMLNRAKLDLGDASLPRTRLLETFESIERNYPRSAFADKIRDTVAVLRMMVAEDAAHAARPVVPLANLPLDQRVEELVFRLRDENWHDDVYPGTAADLAGQEKSPSDLLVAIGFPAVPQLIATLNDRRLSRTIIDDSNFGALLSHVLTMGECAENTLARIAGRDFYPTQSQSSSQLAEAWWKELQRKGEKQALIDAVSQGGADAGSQARLLRAHYPDEVLAAIIQGTKNSNASWTRQQFMFLTSAIPGDGPVPYLEEELHTGLDLAERLTAAKTLGARGHNEEATAAMISEWEKPHPAGPSENFQQPGDEKAFWDGKMFDDLIDFLAGCGRVDAIEALGRDLRHRSVQERMHVVMAINPRGPHRSIGTSAANEPPTDDGEKDHRQQLDEESKVNAAAEAVLAAELEDTEKYVGLSGSIMAKDYSDPRVCDMAGEILAEHFPSKYVFDLNASLEERDRQRLACLNIWRGEHAGAALPTSP